MCAMPQSAIAKRDKSDISAKLPGRLPWAPDSSIMLPVLYLQSRFSIRLVISRFAISRRDIIHCDVRFELCRTSDWFSFFELCSIDASFSTTFFPLFYELSIIVLSAPNYGATIPPLTIFLKSHAYDIIHNLKNFRCRAKFFENNKFSIPPLHFTT